ncbi:5'-3' exoribonuclease 2 homolog [Hyposmocoma kahamanoa]|uniref:5'-3' exoribonuclease 2 homolog n=1 Tax=Hyposmocoma kahamanoa TaxID=1477025 RepID=UPI000E6DA44E|nr:5'-3' exoribonuclease 2 homolog [Hyposmocoma kahamanoa]
MGVPAFFRWLSRKYSSVIVECVEQKPKDVDGQLEYADSSLPNPNGVEFDNLYLDMNGIIHPCTHPEDKPPPKDEDEMMVAIFECIDRLFRIVRPRKLLYMAIDGVAPRAKMNQQRSRRFRASKETQEKIEEVARIRSELQAKGAYLPPERPKEAHFDSNCITPGTPFMDRLSKCLHYYIHDRLNNDPGWRGIKVILSDANVPGEGEHKIMDYIRRQRAQPDHDPNTQHVLCGADADLIMLGLATHEPNFTIIREEFKPNKPRPCDVCGQLGHEMKECTGTTPDASLVRSDPAFGNQDNFIFVRLSVLREYLEKELQMPNLPFPYDFERALDDWVFMCFFVGNDFLPHLPSLEIREGAVDRLVNLYKKCVYKTRGWITDSGDVNLDRVQVIMDELGHVEDEIFKRRHQNELNFKARDKAKKRQKINFALLDQTQFAPAKIGEVRTVKNARQEAADIRLAGMKAAVQEEDSQRGRKRSATQAGLENDEDDDDDKNDEVRLWEEGFKERYYESKFEVATDNMEFRYRVALQYVRGLCWVLRYYYQGCASWKWYFPYHYAPFASDFVNIQGLSTKFEKGTQPFRPLEQLMGVFPAASSQHVPKPWATLMSDPFSPIIDFYPTDFKIDLNGKKFAWQGVALLPFVDENRLFKALEPYYKELTQAELQRNTRGHDRLYVSTGNKSFEFLLGLYEQAGHDIKKLIASDQKYPFRAEGVRGDVMLSADCVCQGGQLASPVIGLRPVLGNRVVCVRFVDPQFPDDFVFPARRLKLAQQPPRVLKPGDLSHQENRNWKPQIGMVRSHTIANLEAAGHRMLGHHLPRDRSYTSVPPPQHQQQHNRSQSFGPYRTGYVAHGSQQNFNQGYNQGYSQNQSNHQSYSQSPQGYQGQSRSGYNQSGPERFGQNRNQNQSYGYQQNRRGGYSGQSQGYNNQNQGHSQGYNSNRQGHQGQGVNHNRQGYYSPGQNPRYQSGQSNQRSTWR